MWAPGLERLSEVFPKSSSVLPKLWLLVELSEERERT